MIAEFGHFLIALALAASAAQMAFGLIGPARLMGAPGAAAASAEVAVLSSAAAMVLLIAALVQSDFSIAYVVDHSHVDKPLFYKIAAGWGGHEGSMLLWCLLLAVFGWGLARFAAGGPGVQTRAAGLQGALQTAFFAFLVFASNPFERVFPAPFEGADLNPILQDPAIAIHPPLLFIGYVGLSAAFALAGAGLLERMPGRALAAAIRPWALGAWASLGAGIALGSWWAYYELGWGGWWFWDPVENASFMPWLAGAALIHSAIATEKRGAFAGWTVFLALIAFLLSILGAFLVRSGVITSVHAFALDPERGFWLLAILAGAMVGGFTLFAMRARSLGEGDGFDPTSREAFIGANNLLLAVTAGVVLFGTLFPLIGEAQGRPVSVGPPYYNIVANGFLLLALAFMPIAPFLPWTNGGAKPALKQMRAAVLLVPVAAAGGIILWYGGSVLAVIGGALGAWAIAGAVSDFAGPVKRAMAQGERLRGAGRALAHMGVGLVALGAAADASRAPERNLLMGIGESVETAGRTFTLERIARADGANYIADRGEIRVDGGEMLYPERRFYPAADQNTREVALGSSLAGDVYVSIGEARTREDGSTGYEVRIAFHPLVWALGLGASLVTLGAALAFAGGLRARKRIPASRTDEAPA